jgi:hypothetical protein
VLARGQGATLPLSRCRAVTLSAMDATWVRRELPVLEAIIADLDMSSATSMWPDGGDIAARTGLSLTEVGAALQALDGHYIALARSGGPSDWHVTSVTPEARRAAGQWPSAEGLVEEIAAQISKAAEREPDSDRKRRLLAVARELAGATKQIAVNVASAYLERGLPHA